MNANEVHMCRQGKTAVSRGSLRQMTQSSDQPCDVGGFQDIVSRGESALENRTVFGDWLI